MTDALNLSHWIDGERVEVEGAGHAANLTHPEPTNAAIEAFLARI